MGDLDRNIAADQTVSIVGDDENYTADVILATDGVQRLAVQSETSISSDLRITQEYDLNIKLDDVNYYVVYTENGSVTISGFVLKFNDKKVFVKLTVDSQVIFDLSMEKLKELINNDQAPQPDVYVSWNDNTRAFYFTPKFPIKSATNITIEARSKLGQSKKYLGGIIQVG